MLLISTITMAAEAEVAGVAPLSLDFVEVGVAAVVKDEVARKRLGGMLGGDGT